MLSDPLVLSFLGAFGGAGIGLATAITLGRAGRRRAHVVAVGVFLALFVLTVVLAECVGRSYAFDPTARTVHLPIAAAGALSALLPLATGFRFLKGKGSRGAHRAAIGVFLALFVAAVATGLAMMVTGVRRG